MVGAWVRTRKGGGGGGREIEERGGGGREVEGWTWRDGADTIDSEP